MAIQSSGAISIQDIVDEFGGSTPHSLSEYYRGGSEVGSNNTNVPTSGEISLSDFYGAIDEIVIAASNGDTNINLSSLFGSNFTAAVPKRFTIASGHEIGATSRTTYAINVPSGMGGTLTIQNAGTISGGGGTGGTGGASGANNGTAGGSAIYIASNNVTITNTGTIRGGGGGGGGGNNGAAGQNGFIGGSGNLNCFGGAGGAGGDGGNGQGYNSPATNGQAGAAGGSRFSVPQYQGGNHPFCEIGDPKYQDGQAGGNGGNGGSFGNAGSNGDGNGGAAGKYIELNSGISLANTPSGTLQGTAP
tara:strand:+ start:4661 stop:5572 length:912 start_codon:yes stop_codon:yes gene_type:complete